MVVGIYLDWGGREEGGEASKSLYTLEINPSLSQKMGKSNAPRRTGERKPTHIGGQFLSLCEAHMHAFCRVCGLLFMGFRSFGGEAVLFEEEKYLHLYVCIWILPRVI